MLAYPVAYAAVADGRALALCAADADAGPAPDELRHQDLRDPLDPRAERLPEQGADGTWASSARHRDLLVFNLNAILVSLTLLLIPFAILPIFLSLEGIPRQLLSASDDLGASRFQGFLNITLPLSLPGIASAASFVFVLAIGDFLTPQMVGGISGFTFGRIIYSQFGTAFNWPFGAALSVILALVVIVAILAGERLGRRKESRR